MKQKTKTLFKSLLLVVGFVASVTAVAVWIPPDADPLTNSTSNPLNVSRYTQAKPDGGLVLGFIRVAGLALVNGNAQIDGNVTIGTAGPRTADSLVPSTASSSAALQIVSTDKGLLLPRLTQVQRDRIISPEAGLLIYQKDNRPGLYVYNGVAWTELQAVSKETLIP